MKHTKRVTLILLALFLAAQYIGLFVVDQYTTREIKIVDGKTVVETSLKALPYEIERPEFEEETSYIPIIILIFITTGLILLIVKFRLDWLWKSWFFLSILFCLIISFGAFMSEFMAFILALILTILKVFKRNPITHNISELFLYGGLAAVFAPVMNLVGIIVLLLLISVYDFIAVLKTKHMVVMAKYQTHMQLFAGLLIPYKKKTAILGGGDIGLPLLFAAVVLKTNPIAASIIPLFAALALLYLFVYGKKDKFYPAMPYVTAGCLLVYGYNQDIFTTDYF